MAASAFVGDGRLPSNRRASSLSPEVDWSFDRRACFDYFFGFLCGDKVVSHFVYSHPIVPCTLEMFSLIDHHHRCTLHVIYRSRQSVQLSRKIFLPPLFRLTWNGISGFGINRKRLHIGSKHGSRLVLSEGTTGPPQVSYVSPHLQTTCDLDSMWCWSPQARPQWPGALYHLVIW